MHLISTNSVTAKESQINVKIQCKMLFNSNICQVPSYYNLRQNDLEIPSQIDIIFYLDIVTFYINWLHTAKIQNVIYTLISDLNPCA